MKVQPTESALPVIFLGIALVIALQSVKIIETKTRQASGDALNTVLQTTNESLGMWAVAKTTDARRFASHLESLKLVDPLVRATSRNRNVEARSITASIRGRISPELEALGYRGYFLISDDFTNVSSNRDNNIGIRNLIADRRPDLLARVWAGETLIIPAMESDVPLSRSDLSSGTNSLTMFAATPLRDSDRNIIAIFTLRLDPQTELNRLTMRGRLGTSGETYAIDHYGYFLTESRFKHRLPGSSAMEARVQAMNSNPGNGLRSAAPSDRLRASPPGETHLTTLAQSATRGGRGVDTSGYTDYRGIKVLGAWLWNEELGIGLATEIDATEALEAFYQTRRVILGGYFGTVGLTILLLIYLALVRTQAVNALEKSQAVLEERVSERTQSLVEINKMMQEQIVERVRTEEQLKQTQESLEASNHKLEDMALVDGLTGIANRRAFDQHLAAEWKRCQRLSVPMSFIMFDIDHFKLYNDAYGHQAGDACLKKITEMLRVTSIGARTGDLLARYGGEEFAIVISGCQMKDALVIAEKIQHNISLLEIKHETTEVVGSQYVTTSIGVATLVPSEPGEEARIIGMADQALYRAKDQGRNTIVAANGPESGDTAVEMEVLKHTRL